MAVTTTRSHRIAGVVSCVPSTVFDNTRDCTTFPEEDVRKVVAMAGINKRHVSDEGTCSSDLCTAAAKQLLKKLDWEPDTINALIMVTQSPDYFLPSTACVVHANLGLPMECAAFDVGLGCSGYTYGLWLASMMLQTPGFKRVLLLHGETPSRFTHESDRSVFLLFGDVGTATAIEAVDDQSNSGLWHFCMNTDGTGYDVMLMKAGGFRQRTSPEVLDYCVSMDGARIFNFTVKRVPSLVKSTLQAGNYSIDDIDYFIFHQSNRFIMKHLGRQLHIPDEKLPIILDQFGNTGGASVPLTLTQGAIQTNRLLRVMLAGYGVGLSWGSALVHLDNAVILDHCIFENV